MWAVKKDLLEEAGKKHQKSEEQGTPGDWEWCATVSVCGGRPGRKVQWAEQGNPQDPPMHLIYPAGNGPLWKDSREQRGRQGMHLRKITLRTLFPFLF